MLHMNINPYTYNFHFYPLKLTSLTHEIFNLSIVVAFRLFHLFFIYFESQYYVYRLDKVDNSFQRDFLNILVCSLNRREMLEFESV